MESEQIFSTTLRGDNAFNFGDFYKFCYDWLMDEIGFDFITETKYQEKIMGNKKDVFIEWDCFKKITDYFRIKVHVYIEILGLEKVEVIRDGNKIGLDKGRLRMDVKGDLQRDYQSKFERSATSKFWRGIYERWVIASRIDQMEGKLAWYCDQFITQIKAYLDLEGRKNM